MDDVINVSGHRIGTAEVESALVGHPAVAEAAVVPQVHPIKVLPCLCLPAMAVPYSFPCLRRDRYLLNDGQTAK